MALTIPKVRTKTGVTDDPEPNTTPPAAGTTIIGKGTGIRGYLHYETPPQTATITVWVKNAHADATGRKWIDAGTLDSWPDVKMFKHSDVDGCEVFLQLTNITGADDTDVFAEGY